MSTLKVSGLTKDYGNKLGVFNFNLSMKSKDIVLLLGPNGAGKTTAIRGLLGLTKVKDARITYNGQDIKEDLASFLKSVGACVSTPNFYEYMTGYENLELYAKFYPVSKERIDEVFDIVELSEAKDKKVAEYSTGMKQRLDFARGILHNPELLVLDEPFNGMDIEQKANLKGYLKGLKDYSDQMILISSHMIGELEQLANRIIVLYEGKCLFEGSMEAALEEYGDLETFYLEVIKNFKNQEV